MICGSKCAKPQGHVGPHDFEMALPISSKRWWECFFKAMDLINGPLEHTMAGDRGAKLCAEFADQAMVEAMSRGMV